MKYYLEERSLVRKDALCPKSLINCKSSSSIISKGRASSSSSSSLSILLPVPTTTTTTKSETGIRGIELCVFVSTRGKVYAFPVCQLAVSKWKY